MLEKIGNVTLNYDFYPGEDLYSDGEIEDILLDITKNTSRVEYQSIIEERRSWPILYHLSALRGNIVDWLPITKEHKVLEIGSGCGAITDTLSQKAGRVTCVDLSSKRSQINAYRNQDRDNIEIHVGNFNDIEPTLDTDYDFACMIGVFEYGNSYIPTKTPYEDFLQIMRKHVRPGGTLVIAIENRLGMKYFAGCKEDHDGRLFSGIEGYPEGGSARTFSRSALENIFKNCGISNYHFYYPYPDYKFPTTIFSDKRLPNPGELTDNIRNFDRDRMLLFNEKYAYDGMIRDGYFPIFANSYCVVIGDCPEISYTKYSNDRQDRYKLRTDICDTENGRLVRKHSASQMPSEHISELQTYYDLLSKRFIGSQLKINPCIWNEKLSCAEFPYENGITLEELLDECIDRGDEEKFFELFTEYYKRISFVAPDCDPVTDLDLIFSNILVDGDDWTVIDYEWTVKEFIEPSEIAFRAAYCYVLEEEKRNRIELGRILEILGISDADAEEYREKEGQFQKKVTGKHRSMGEIRAMLGTYVVDAKELMDHHLQDILHKRIQLYFDTGAGFSEENSEYKPDVYVDEYLVETNIDFDGNLKNLRIDPADKPVLVHVKNLTLNGYPIDLSQGALESNGCFVGEGVYSFETADPNLTLHLQGLNIQRENTLEVQMEVMPLTFEASQKVKERISGKNKKGLLKWL